MRSVSTYRRVYVLQPLTTCIALIPLERIKVELVDTQPIRVEPILLIEQKSTQPALGDQSRPVSIRELAQRDFGRRPPRFDPQAAVQIDYVDAAYDAKRDGAGDTRVALHEAPGCAD